MEFLTWLQEQCYQTFIEDDRWRIYFLKGLGTTFKITIGALILGVIIGIIRHMTRSAAAGTVWAVSCSVWAICCASCI